MRNAIIALKDKRKEHGQHAGLLLQRYLCENATGENGNPEEKRAILEEKRAILTAAINAAADNGGGDLYAQAFKRWKNALRQHGAQTIKTAELATPGRLIVGLGSENVLETGITLHHTYGLPIIPGSALKGLAAHYCNQVYGIEDNQFRKPTSEDQEVYRKYLIGDGTNPGDNHHRLLFGDTDDSGCIIFHDAWYVPGSSAKPSGEGRTERTRTSDAWYVPGSSAEPLCLDVMTPHHPQWLDGSAPPTDFDSPTPVPFLSVTGRFHIAVAWGGPDSDESKNWIDLALSLVSQALADWGIGAKTSSGYGRLIDPKSIRDFITTPTVTPAQLPKAGDKVEAVLLDEKTKKGGWKAKHGPTGLAGPIQNTAEIPADKNAGDSMELIVAIANAKEIAFRYPTAADEQRAQKKKQSKGKGSKRGRR